MSDKILVLGATGHVGTPLVSQLVAGGQAVKAASRHATPIAGAEAVRFDYADASTFDAALAVYARGAFEQMGRMEGVIFPAARRYLSDADWIELDVLPASGAAATPPGAQEIDDA